MSTSLGPVEEETLNEDVTVMQILDQVEEYVMTRAAEISQYHDSHDAGDVTVEAMDELIVDVLELKNIADRLDEIKTRVNKSTMRLESKAGNYLELLGRENYQAPFGVVERKREWHVNMPATPEDKLLLLEHMKEIGVYEQYATVNSKALNSLFMAEWAAAKKMDPAMEVLFSMPGVPEPTINEFTRIKAPRGKRSKRKDVDNDDDSENGNGA